MSDLCLLSNYSAKIIKFFIIVSRFVNKYPLFTFLVLKPAGTEFA